MTSKYPTKESLCIYKNFCRDDDDKPDQEGDDDAVMEVPMMIDTSAHYPDALSLTKALQQYGFEVLTNMLTSYITIHRVLPSDTCTRLWRAAKSMLKVEWRKGAKRPRGLTSAQKVCFDRFEQLEPTLDTLREAA